MANPDDIKRAAAGREYWNEWAEANAKAEVDFSGRDFDATDFRGFIFPGDAKFEGCCFSGKALFDDAKFKGKANFSYTVFNAYVGLDRVCFLNDAIFEHSRFEQYAYFVHSTFKFANFKSATFSGKLEITNSRFRGETDFTRVKTQ